jgi:hypothetical protein
MCEYNGKLHKQFTDFKKVYVSVISERSLVALMMEAVHTSETSVNIYLTIRQYIPEL